MDYSTYSYLTKHSDMFTPSFIQSYNAVYFPHGIVIYFQEIRGRALTLQMITVGMFHVIRHTY